jgi:hypothetical protein
MTFIVKPTYKITICPEHRTPATRQWVHQGGGQVQLWICNAHGHAVANADVETIEAIDVKTATDNLRWLAVAESELQPITEQAGVDAVVQAGAALDALSRLREQLDH